MNEKNSDNQEPSQKRKYLGVYFDCCHAYGRLYQNKMGTAYVGRCPRCLRNIRVNIDKNSTNASSRRFFSAD